MSLATGSRLGAYEILALIGSGGMGEVYRGRDLRLGRDVAIKILAAGANDPDGLARFEREAQMLATLDHPNIAQIYGVEDAGGVSALVMELVDGTTLADRLTRGPLPIEDALPIAKQIAEALEAAHDHGIVHRDLKPANIKIRPDGTVKVLDFGIAKVVDPVAAISQAPTAETVVMDTHPTRAGMILGTPAYMAPEQVRGIAVDKRADIWSFGIVLFEMLSGRALFAADTPSDVMAAVLREPIELKTLPRGVPPSIRRLLARCLERHPKRRLRDIGEARIAIDGAGEREEERTAMPSGAVLAVVTAAAVAGMALTAAAAWYLKPAPTPSISRFAVTMTQGPTFAVSNRHAIAISPDGSLIAYIAAGRGIYLRSLSDPALRLIQGTDAYGVSELTFSPDGQSIAFYATADQTLKRIAIGGGSPTTISPADNSFGISWEADAIYVGQGPRGIMRVSPDGGTPEVVVEVTRGQLAQGPQLLPNGDLLFAVTTGGAWDRAQIVTQSLRTGERRTIVDGGSDPRFSPTGHLLYAVGGMVFAAPFDPGSTRLSGTASPVIEGVRRTAVGGDTGASNFAFSRAGSLVYIPGAASTDTLLPSVALIDRRGDVEPLNLPSAPYRWLRISPDGRRLALNSDDADEGTIWTCEMSGRSTIHRVNTGGSSRFPIWSADNQRITYQLDRDGDRSIYWQAVDTASAPERLTTAPAGEAHLPESWSPRGDWLLYSVARPSEHTLWAWSPESRTAAQIEGVRSPFPLNATFSPDGRWIAYAGTTAGRTTIRVRPFPSTGADYELFATGADNPHHPVWAPDGREIFFDPRAGVFRALAVITAPAFAFGNPVDLPRRFISNGSNGRRIFDIAPSGKIVGLVEPRSEGASGEAQMLVVLNWFEELRSRVPVQ